MREVPPTVPTRRYNEDMERLEQQLRWDDYILKRALQDYDRRMSKRWGRFLMWLLRHTT